MKPWMSNKDIRLIEQEILGLKKSHISVLEWGSGGSTEHFSKFMTDNDITYDWVSLEYNRKWFDKVVERDIPNTKIVLFDVGNTNLKQVKTNMDKYVEYPLSLGKKFDLVLVDGRKRRRCLINTSSVVKPGGIVLLHDADRKYYHCAFDSFSNHEFLSESLWVARIPDIISVIMPAWNLEKHKKFFKQAVDGIINQTYENWELLIVCDGGGTRTVDIAKDIAKSYGDNRIRVFKSRSKRGPGVTRNLAYKYINGNYVTFHDSDDFSVPTRFEKLMFEMGDDEIVASYVRLDITEQPSKSRIKGYTGATLLAFLKDKYKIRVPIHLPSAIISTRLFEDMGGFEEFMFSSDSIFVIKLGYMRELLNIEKIRVIPEPFFVWRRQPYSVTTMHKNSYTLLKCQKSQRKPLRKNFRPALLSGKCGSTKDEIKHWLGIHNCLSGLPNLERVQWG